MGKKDSKRTDKAKIEAKKERKAVKQEKTAQKRVKKESKDSSGKEQDIEAILAEFALKERQRTAVTITLLPRSPSPRAQFSLTSISSSNDMLLFGGEFFDGEQTVVYNEVYRWNVDKNEWKLIESLNTPSPRCSHQAVFYKDRVYIFGGEYATLDQFYHYRDMWCLDVRTNVWKEIKPSGDVPSARSGHRMVVWRNYIVLFGGFYEALRDVKWYNDLYLFSFQEERWIQITYKAHSQIPKPRSGHQMFLHAAEDCIYVYGGFSKEKIPGRKAEGKIHDDMWMLNLRPLIASSASVTKDSIDVGKLTWQRISKKGYFPSPRSGASMIVYKNKAVLFGGVYDVEGPRHSMISTFYNDMYAFDLERRRWYQLGLKQPVDKSQETDKASKKSKKDKSVSDKAAAEVESDESEDDDDAQIDDPDAMLPNYDDGNFFGFIDETGNVVYVDLEAEEDAIAEAVSTLTVTSIEGPTLTEESSLTMESLISTDDIKIEVVSIVEEAQLLESPSIKPAASSSVKVGKDSGTTLKSTKAVNPSKASPLPISMVFLDRKDPHPRINSCLILRGNSLLVYGGITEIGDIEVTLDDCWTLDLNKRDHWKQVLHGTMEALTWKGEDDDMTESTRSEGDSDNKSDDDSDDKSDSEDSDDEEEEDDEEEMDDEATRKKSSARSKDTTDAGSKKGRQTSDSGKATSLKDEMERLRNELGVVDTLATPVGGESLRDFYSRTTEYWTQQVIQLWRDREAAGSGMDSYQSEILTEKAIKREGFKLAETRYNQLLPILARLNELEEQQREFEEQYDQSKKSKSSKRR